MTPKPLAWIVGASRGIGAAVATALHGHRLVLSARSEPLLSTLADSIASPDVTVYPCDVTNRSTLDAAHASAVASHGPVDVLVYCAGVGTFAPLLELTSDDLDQHHAVNVRGLFDSLQLVVPTMIQRGSGHIININSVAVLEPFANCTVYGASKAAARAMLRSLRTEVRSHGIKVTDVYVGATDTDIWPTQARTENAHRMMTADDVASVIASCLHTTDSPRLHLEEIVLRPQGGDL